MANLPYHYTGDCDVNISSYNGGSVTWEQLETLPWYPIPRESFRLKDNIYTPIPLTVI